MHQKLNHRFTGRLTHGRCRGPWQLCLLLGVVALTACVFEGTDGPSTTLAKEEPVCTADAQCPERQICRKNYCVVETASPLEIGLNFIPPNSSPYLPQRIEPRLLDVDDELQIGLEASIAIHGKVFFADAATLGPTGVLIVRRPQAEDSFFTYQIPVTRGNFQGFILPGHYDLHFVPDDPSLPRKVWRNKLFTSDTVEELALPQPRELLTVTGSITHKHAAANGEGNDLPVPNARVIAIATDTGNMSTAAVTDESGNYQIQVFPRSGTYALHISPADDTTIIPEVVIEGRFVAETFNPPPVSVSLGTYLPVSLPLNLQLFEPDSFPSPDLLDFEAMTVVFRGQVGNGKVSRQATVTSSGRVNVNLLPAVYDIEIIPSAQSPLARTLHRHELTALLDRLELTLLLKQRVQGRVQHPDGTPLENTRLRFEATSVTGERSAGRSQSESFAPRTTTDMEGRFEVWLEPSNYVVTVTPQGPTGLGRQLLYRTADALTGSDEWIIDVTAPSLLAGTLYGDDWAPVPDVTVQAFANLAGRLRVVGEAQSNGRGEFRLLLPAELPQVP
jgi:Cys-rich repeat protein